MTQPDHNSDGHSDGLLDGEERRYRVDLRGASETVGHYPPRTFRQVVMAMATLVMAISATYVVPDLYWMQPWKQGSDYVPFWNLIGRELLGEGARVEEKRVEIAAVEEQARAEVAAEDKAEPFVDKQVREPVAEGERLPAYAGHA